MRRFRRAALGFVLVAARAGALEPIDVRPADAPVAWPTVGILRGTEALGEGNASVQLWSTYRAVPTTSDAATRSMMLGEVAGAYGLSPRLSLGFSLPVLVRGYGVAGVPLSALGDARLLLSHTAIAPGVVGPGLAWTVGVRAPSGERQSGIAYATPALSASLHGEYRLALVEALAHLGAFRVLGSAKSDEGAVPLAPRTMVDASFGMTIRMRDLFRVGPTHARIELAATTRMALAGSTAFDATFVHLSERFALDADGDTTLHVSLGMAAAGATEAFGSLGLRYAPRVHDADGDGVPDRLDQCPELEEDRDGFEDADGCPDIDNDGDDVGDEDDRCPNEPGDAEHQGCPAPKSPVPTDDRPNDAPRDEPASDERPLPPR